MVEEPAPTPLWPPRARDQLNSNGWPREWGLLQDVDIVSPWWTIICWWLLATGDRPPCSSAAVWFVVRFTAGRIHMCSECTITSKSLIFAIWTGLTPGWSQHMVLQHPQKQLAASFFRKQRQQVPQPAYEAFPFDYDPCTRVSQSCLVKALRFRVIDSQHSAPQLHTCCNQFSVAVVESPWAV